MTISELWDYLIDNNIATEEALNIITNINGYTIDTLNDVLYSVTGYRNIDQYLEA